MKFELKSHFFRRHAVANPGDDIAGFPTRPSVRRQQRKPRTPVPSPRYKLIIAHHPGLPAEQHTICIARKTVTHETTSNHVPIEPYRA